MTNSGFRPQELDRRRFQQAAVQTLDAQARFVADLSVRVDNLETRQRSFEQMTWWARVKWIVGR